MQRILTLYVGAEQTFTQTRVHARMLRILAFILALAFFLHPTLSVAQEAAGNADASAKVELPTALTNPRIDPNELDIRLVPLTRAELKQLAAAWARIVKAKTEEIMEVQVAIAQSGDEVAEAARQQLTQLDDERKQLFDKFSAILNSWEKKAGDEKAIANYRAYRNAIMIEEARTADLETFVARIVSWLSAEDGGIQLGKGIGVIILSLMGLLIVAKIVQGLARRWVERIPKTSKPCLSP